MTPYGNLDPCEIRLSEDLLPDGTEPLPEPMLTRGIHMKAILQEVLMDELNQ